MNLTKEKESHKYATFVYGILVGLAIKEALERVIPHLIEPQNISSVSGGYLSILRLAVFLLLIIRFYLGSVYFFDFAYESESSDEIYPRKSYAFDFVFQFLHFVCFLILSFTIDSRYVSARLYFYLVGFILIYDVLWLAFSFKQDTLRLTFWWSLVNAMNALVSAVIYLTVERLTGSILTAEIWALCPIIVVSLIDLGWMMRRKPFFEPIRDVLIQRERPSRDF